MRWGSCVYASLSTSSVSLRLTASPHRGSLGVRRSKASPSRGAVSRRLTEGLFAAAADKGFPYEGKLSAAG